MKIASRFVLAILAIVCSQVISRADIIRWQEYRNGQWYTYERIVGDSSPASGAYLRYPARHYHANTPWSKLQRGMSPQQVCGLLGAPDIDYAFWGMGTQSWKHIDRCQGFDQVLYFSVHYRYMNGRWVAWNKDVDWMSEWWEGAGEYDHYDVSDEWQ